MEIIPPFVVDAIKDIKDFNEVMLARELYDLFESIEELKRPLREIAHVAVDYVRGLCTALEGRDELAQLHGVLGKESGLKIWGDTKPASGASAAARLEGLSARWRTFTTNDCSEALRLFGGVIEEVRYDGYTPTIANERNEHITATMLPRSELDMLRSAYRSAYGEAVSGTLWRAAQREGVTAAAPFRGDVRMRDQARMSSGSDVRFTAPNAPFTEGETLRPLSPAQLQYVMGSSVRTEDREVRGMTLWKLKEGSTTWAMDRIFGLPPGADISGTTADLMWGMELISSMLYQPIGKVDSSLTNLQGHRLGMVPFYRELPLLYLLPIAAMVAHYHHTILECALTQTFNSEIEYAVGFYTSLLPKRASTSSAADRVLAILKKWEEHPLNFKMVLFDEDDGKWGAIFTEKGEIEAFRRFATVNYERYATVFRPLKDNARIGLGDISSQLGIGLLDARRIMARAREDKLALATLLGRRS